MIEKNFHNEFHDIVSLIEKSRQNAYRKVNEELIFLYYSVGKIVSGKVVTGKWGDNIVGQLAVFIHLKMPDLSGFNKRGLYRMKQFFETYSPDSDFFNFLQQLITNVTPTASKIDLPIFNHLQIVSATPTQLQDVDYLHNKFMSAMLTQLSWTHHLEIFSVIKKPGELLFYLMQVIHQNLTSRELRRQIKTATYERTMLSENKAVINNKSPLPAQIFKDPYIFEFLDLPELHTEKDLEEALIQNFKNFILEIGKGFTYMGNQFRIQVGNKDYHTDLLFYHRNLQCLVLFELKIEEFQPEFLGKLNFYLEALDRDVKQQHENPSIGVLLCKGKDTEVVEYAMARNISPAIVADYETKLIAKSVLINKLQKLTEQLHNRKEL